MGFYKINFESKSDNVEVENSTFKTYTIEEIKNSLRIDSEGYIKIFGSEYNLGKFINLPFFYQALQSLEGGFGLVLYILFLIFYFVIFIRGNMAFMLDHSSILGCRFLANAKKQFKWSKDLKPSDSATNIEYHVATYGIGAVESIGKYQYLCDFLDPTYSNESNQTPD